MTEQEIAAMKQQVVELTQKAKDRKAKIEILEAALAQANTATQTAQAELTRIQVTEPMQTLAAAISNTSELFLTELQRVGYTVVHQDGKLVLQRDGKAVEGVSVTAQDMRKHLLSDDPAHRNFPHLVVASRASGGGAIGGEGGAFHSTQTSADTKPKTNAFGLR